MRNGGSGRTRVAPAGASSAAARDGTGANANNDGMRSLARRDTQADNIVRGTAREAKSNALATVTGHDPDMSALGGVSPGPPYCDVGAADLQKFRGMQRHKAEEHRTQRNRHYHRLSPPRDGSEQ